MKTIPWARLIFFTLLASVLLLSNKVAELYDQQWDLSSRQRNSLHPSSIQLLQSLQGPVSITAFVPDFPVMRAEIQTLINKYQQQYPALQLTMIDPTTHPAQTRKLGITRAGELLIEYQKKTKKIRSANEASLTNALASLSMNNNRWIVEISGHGEPSLTGKANFDLSVFGRTLTTQGYQLFSHNLLESGAIPNNTNLLLLTAPRSKLGDKEQSIITEYLSSGGNLLWFAEDANLKILQDYLQLKFLPGTVVDAAAADLGIDSPTVAVASRHVKHPIVAQLDAPVLMPGAQAIDTKSTLTGWTLEPLLNTGTRSWNETEEIKGNISRDALLLEQQGPLLIGALLKRELPEIGLQQIIILGDSDFLSNAYIGNGANQILGTSIINALTDNNTQITIPVSAAADQLLRWPPVLAIGISLLFLIILPLTLAVTGLSIRLRRNRR